MPAMGSFGQARTYSSDSNGKDSDVSGFGFQSLGSLFTSPPSQGRYSRPRETRVEQETAPKVPEAEDLPDRKETQGPRTPSKERAEEETARITTEERLQKTMEQELGMFPSPGKPEEVSQTSKAQRNANLPNAIEAKTAASRPVDSKGPRIGDSVVRKVNKDFDWTPGQWAAHLAGADHEKELKRIKESSGALGIGGSPRAGRDRKEIRRSRGVSTRERKPERKKAGSKKIDLKMPNPFAGRARKSEPSAKNTENVENRSDPSAWGLSDQAQVTTVSGGESPTSVPASSLAAGVSESTPTSITRTNGPASSSTTGTGSRLTHVKSSGEAHMVDVGAKPATKRTAIAIGHVKIHSKTYKLIEENSMKKGDVLGTARIAGIMAAKRTSDIIPLCHPLAISKAEVDVYLMPNSHGTSTWGNTTGQLVAIQARVDCVGPTGVEMEAMTAVQGAALTVFDMCKAVDKGMYIQGGRVVYKAGGRTGVTSNERWKTDVGLDKFTESGELKEDVEDFLVRPKQRSQ